MRLFFAWFSLIVFGFSAIFAIAAFVDLTAGRPGAATALAASFGFMVAAGILFVLAQILGKLADISQVLDDDIAESLIEARLSRSLFTTGDVKPSATAASVAALR